MDLDKIFLYKETLQKELTFEEISKLYREVLYNEYENMTGKYLKDKIKW